MKKIALLLISLLSLAWGITIAYNAPSFNDNFAKYLTNDSPDRYGRVETVFNICIDKNIPLIDNIRRMFYPTNIVVQGCPGATNWWLLWTTLKALWFVIMFVYIILNWVSLMANLWDPKAVSKAMKNFIYIWYGAFLFFGSVRLLGSVLNISTIQGSQDLSDKVSGQLFFQVLSFLKTFAFFGAIIMIVIYWFTIMYSSDDSGKVGKATKWILAVVIALVLIKVIDYIFFIAQTPDFATKWADFIINIAKLMAYIIGALFVIYIFYAGFLMITASGDEAQRKKAKTTITIIAISTVVIFMFLLILYQIFNEFWA